MKNMLIFLSGALMGAAAHKAYRDDMFSLPDTDDVAHEIEDKYELAIKAVQASSKVSTSYIQRQLKVGYNTAADMIERMEAEGVISVADHAGRRKVLK